MHYVNLYLKKHISCWTIQKEYRIPSSKIQSWAHSYLLDGRKEQMPITRAYPVHLKSIGTAAPKCMIELRPTTRTINGHPQSQTTKAPFDLPLNRAICLLFVDICKRVIFFLIPSLFYGNFCILQTDLLSSGIFNIFQCAAYSDCSTILWSLKIL